MRMMHSSPEKNTTIATVPDTVQPLAFLDDLSSALARPPIGALDVDDGDDRSRLVLVHERLHQFDDAGQWDLPLQERHHRDLVRGVHHGREGEPKAADSVGEVDSWERLTVDRLEREGS